MVIIATLQCSGRCDGDGGSRHDVASGWEGGNCWIAINTNIATKGIPKWLESAMTPICPEA